MDSTDSDSKKRRVRAKYSRPCDGCALRKVRCDQKKPCSRCVEHNVPCTDNRLKKKCGPKHIHKKTRESINSLLMGNSRINTLGNHNEILTLDKLLPCLQIYQTWYYGIWPVLSVAHLVLRIVQLNPSSDSQLSSDNATSYSLCCAVCAAITRQLAFLTGGNPIVGVPTNIDAEKYALESIRARNLFDYRLNPSYDNLLISFFLYIYYVNVKDGTKAAIMYMKEAISIAQILGLHDPRTYVSKPLAEIHRLRKIYYMLLVTERFMCIEDNVPVCLEPSIPLPSLEEEEYSGLLTGFIELVKVFSIPDKKFFDSLINYSQKNPNNLHSFENLFMSSGTPTKKWIINVQTELKKIEINNASSDTQRLNIILSKHWMRALAWHISSQNGLLIKSTKDSTEACLTYQFPLEIAKDFLMSTENLPIFAFESNGPGVCVKLLEIALAVADSVNECIINKGEYFVAYNLLTSIFNLVSKFKSDITITQELYMKVESMVKRKTGPTPIYTKSYIREVDDDGISVKSSDKEEISKTDEQSMQIPSILNSPNNPQTPPFPQPQPVQSPFTQMTMAFSLSPNHPFEISSAELLKQPELKNDSRPAEVGRPSPQLFQRFNPSQSPSTMQLQQLELQLYHQFLQFRQNESNEYQYGTPEPHKKDEESKKDNISTSPNHPFASPQHSDLSSYTSSYGSNEDRDFDNSIHMNYGIM